MTHTVRIIDVTQAFYNAHQHVLNTRGPMLRTRRNVARAWTEILGVTPVPAESDGHWHWLDFPSREHYLMFVLKWSGDKK